MLKKLTMLNKQRNLEWTKGEVKLSLSFRGVELAGEVGELLNQVKKIERSNAGMVGSKPDMENVKDELGDVLISLNLLAMDLGIDLEQAAIDKFNKTSEKYGLKTKYE